VARDETSLLGFLVFIVRSATSAPGSRPIHLVKCDLTTLGELT